MAATFPFFKYHGAGNDFIMIDHRESPHIDLADETLIRHLCDRHFGIGADGLIALLKSPELDFEMKYYNADGREGSMCGNGGRCTVAFAFQVGIRKPHYQFLAADGLHEAFFREQGWVELKMGDVKVVEAGEDFYFLNTGSPHYVRFVDKVSAVDVCALGKAVRYSDRFRQEGTNVNFVEEEDAGIAVATYERGVEDETLSCGTGITASALVTSLKRGLPAGEPVQIPVRAKGGNLEVRFLKTEEGFRDIWLCGPTKMVFGGVFVR
ncbi:MAG: diaminopimelate epimerase [Saprospirales bacterium]|nr:diaminopimelate epimerase [Saprospirales bacterium]MBK8491079.1 diaminopimelate epimerase [Saprospirales bacterium]